MSARYRTEKLPHWLRDAVASAISDHLEDLYADDVIDKDTKFEMCRLLANAGLPGLLPRSCQRKKLSDEDQLKLKEAIRVRLKRKDQLAKLFPPSKSEQASRKPLSNTLFYWIKDYTNV